MRINWEALLPIRRLDNWVARSLHTERLGVDRTLMVKTGIALALVVSVQFWLPHPAYDFVLQLLAGVVVAGPLGRRMAYHRGYRAARASFWTSMNEAARRGITPLQWAQLESERDAALFGAPVRPEKRAR